MKNHKATDTERVHALLERVLSDDVVHAHGSTCVLGLVKVLRKRDKLQLHRAHLSQNDTGTPRRATRVTRAQMYDGEWQARFGLEGGHEPIGEILCLFEEHAVAGEVIGRHKTAQHANGRFEERHRASLCE